jgi:CheY-like chemotaxis protein
MSPIKILLADDDMEDRFIISDAFNEIGYSAHVHYVESGEETFEYLGKIREPEQLPKLVVLDLNMPRMNGREILERLKANERYRNIGVIIFSTSVNEKESEQCKELGALDYVTKPVKYEDSVAIARMFRDHAENTNTPAVNTH